MKRIAVLLLTSAVFTSACTSTKWVRTNVAEQHDFNVALEHYQEKGVVISQNFDHPYEIEISDLKKLMKDLKYNEESGLMNTEKQTPVFQMVEIDRLAPVLADTLAKADTGQRIRFTSFNQGKTWIFSTPQKTEGVIFIEPTERLNIAFNFINSKRESGEAASIDPIYSSTDPLLIKDSVTTLSAIAPYAELHKFETGEQAPMWVVADLEKLKKSNSATTAPIDNTREEAAPDVSPGVGMRSTPVEKTVPDKAPEEMLKEDIKNKLKFLKELLDEGLISEKDYTVKKKELLDKIN